MWIPGLFATAAFHRYVTYYLDSGRAENLYLFLSRLRSPLSQPTLTPENQPFLFSSGMNQKRDRSVVVVRAIAKSIVHLGDFYARKYPVLEGSNAHPSLQHELIRVGSTEVGCPGLTGDSTPFNRPVRKLR
ncbi:MAG: hypothetical protein F6K30_13990 [Cyanothece sp. SIO2G6]|nr:hypothetical protein [Cyanothece sp. SIO2G6]